jgi:glyoxylase-like metal-dependent hydrolase (beta-lactamase superfamily II)
MRLHLLVPSTLLLAACAAHEPAPQTSSQATPATVGEASNAQSVTASSARATITIDTFTAPDDAGAVNSYLLQDDKELIVIDGQMAVPTAQALVTKIKDSKKTPKAFFLTHAHPDHYLGFAVLQKEFPSVPLYATPGVKADYDATAPATLVAMKAMMGAPAPTELAKITALESPLELGGEKLEVSELKGGEHGVSSVVRVPSLHAMFTGDNLYFQIHNWRKECDATTWTSHLEGWKKNDADTVYYPGHGAGKGGAELIEANLAYLHGFEAEVGQAKGKDDAAVLADAKKRVMTKFPNYKGTQLLDGFLKDYVACTKKPVAPQKGDAPHGAAPTKGSPTKAAAKKAATQK